MDRADAIRKIIAMRNPSGRTPAEASTFRAKADAMQQAHGISESELTQPAPFAFTYTPRTERSYEEAEAIRQAREAMFWAEQAAKGARARAAEEKARNDYHGFTAREQPAKKAKKSPRRGAFQGSVPKGYVHPQTIRDLMAELGIYTNGELANLAGVSPSLVSEWMGKGRGRFVHEFDWKRYETKIRKACGQ